MPPRDMHRVADRPSSASAAPSAATSSGPSPLIVGPTRTFQLAHLLNATSNETLECSDLRYFTVLDVSQQVSWAPHAHAKLIFIARQSDRGAPGAISVIKSLSTAALALSPDGSNSGSPRDQLQLLSTIVPDYALSSNFDVTMGTDKLGQAVLYGLGGHYLAWDVRRGFSKWGRHDSNGRRLRPRDGLHLLRATRLADVLNGAWLPWSQFLPDGAASRELPSEAAALNASETAARRARKASVVIRGSHPGCLEVFNRYAPLCYFDSKLSLTRFHGRYLVFARANTVERGGGRFVQVASSAGDNPAGPYAPPTLGSNRALPHVDRFLFAPFKPRVIASLRPLNHATQLRSLCNASDRGLHDHPLG